MHMGGGWSKQIPRALAWASRKSGTNTRMGRTRRSAVLSSREPHPGDQQSGFAQDSPGFSTESLVSPEKPVLGKT